ncbi:histidine phosphatase family protein [Reinekea forsetii]|nr:histidine phosphatase family protein [Reinekea forsetii]
MKIYLLRHAESESNALGRLASSSDESLTSVGMIQAESIVPELKELGVTKVLCSTYLRARQTVKPFIDEVAIEIEYSDLLTEGELVLGKRPLVTTSDRQSDLSDAADSFLNRAILAVELMKGQKCRSLLVVTHGHMIRELINLFLDLPNTVRFPQENCALSLVELSEHVKVEYLNRRLGSNNHGLGTRSSPQP